MTDLTDDTSTRHVTQKAPFCNFKPRAHGAAFSGAEAPHGGEKRGQSTLTTFCPQTGMQSACALGSLYWNRKKHQTIQAKIDLI